MQNLTDSQGEWLYQSMSKFRRRTPMLMMFSIITHPEVTCTNADLAKLIPKSEKDAPITCSSHDFTFTDAETTGKKYNNDILHENIVIVDLNGNCYGVHKPSTSLDVSKDVVLTYLRPHNDKEPVLQASTTVQVDTKHLINYKEPTPAYTTVGHVLTNYMLYIHPFGDLIPYVTEEWDLTDTEYKVSDLYLTKTIDLSAYPLSEKTPHDSFMNNFYFLLSFGHIFTPVYSVKALSTSDEVLKRKKELLEQYKDRLHEPVIGALIENELIKLDKEYLKDDVAYGFYGSAGKKFKMHRKKLFLTEGSLEEFGGTDINHYEFVPESLAEGWTKESLPAIINEMRKGMAERAIETAKGGETTKMLLRVFQNFNLTEKDCGTKDYLILEKATIQDLEPFLGHYALDKSGKIVKLSNENLHDFAGTDTRIRSLMHCIAKSGGCATCAGSIFESLGTDAAGVFTVAVGRAFLMLSMKKMHGTKVEYLETESLDAFLNDEVENE